MSGKASKKSNEGGRKKKLREESESEETKRPKKLKISKNATRQMESNGGGGAVEESGGKNNSDEDVPHNSDKAETEDHEQELINWPQEDLQQLVTRMEMLLPEKDNLAFCTRVEKLNWEKIAFNDYTAEECKKTWTLIQKRIRRFRILTEVLKDARDWITKPWTNFYKAGKTKNHPEMPRRPLSTYMLFYLQKKDEVIAKNPGMEMTDVSKKLSELYKTLSVEEREKYSKMALEKRKEYEGKLQEFYTNHPECLQVQEKPKVASDAGPVKPLTPFMLFCKEQMKKGQNSNEGEAKELWKTLWNNMSDKKKVVWINWAAEEEAKYKETLKDYVSQHPNYVPPQVKSVLTKKEKLIQERVAGKPVKPPNSAYSLFSRIMLQSEDIKNIDAKNRLNYVSQQWRLCSEEMKQGYKERADHLMEQYKLDFASYLESLPEDKRVEELKNNMPKRKTKDTDENTKKKKQVKDDYMFKGEPRQPPLTAIALFKSKYKGKRSVTDAWKKLSDKHRKKFGDQVDILKSKYIAEFEVFLKSLSKEEIKAYKKHRKELEERYAAKERSRNKECSGNNSDSKT